MKLLKGIMLASALIVLTACGPEKEKSSQDEGNVPQTSGYVEQDSSEQGTSEQEVSFNLVKLDYSSFELAEYAGQPYTYVNKSYVVKVYAYNSEDQEHPIESDQIEYFVGGYDGTTLIDYVKSEQGEKPNEFIITPLPSVFTKGMGSFDLRGRARRKGDQAWLTAYNPLSSVNVLEDPTAE